MKKAKNIRTWKDLSKKEKIETVISGMVFVSATTLIAYLGYRNHEMHKTVEMLEDNFNHYTDIMSDRYDKTYIDMIKRDVEDGTPWKYALRIFYGNNDEPDCTFMGETAYPDVDGIERLGKWILEQAGEWRKEENA